MTLGGGEESYPEILASVLEFVSFVWDGSC